MPKGLYEAREVAKALYLQGLQPSQIARKVGCKPATVSTWSKRYQWPKVRDKADEIVSQDERMQAYESQVKTRLSRHLDRSTACLDKLNAPTSLKGMREHAEAMIPVVTVASKVFGWGNNGMGNSGVMIGTLNQTVSDTIRPAKQQPTIEAETVDPVGQTLTNEDQSS